MNKTRRVAMGAWVVVVAAMPIGCQPAIAWWVAVTAPPQKVKALYIPPKGMTALVFVDDILNPVDYQPIKAELTERLNTKLVAEEIAVATIPYETVLQWMARTPNAERLSVAEVGRALGAGWVLYVHIDKFSVKDNPQSPLWHGELGVTVRVVDVQTGRLWPLDRPEGYAVPWVETPTMDESSADYASEVARQLAEAMADRVAKLFYEHSVPAMDAPEPEKGL